MNRGPRSCEALAATERDGDSDPVVIREFLLYLSVVLVDERIEPYNTRNLVAGTSGHCLAGKTTVGL